MSMTAVAERTDAWLGQFAGQKHKAAWIEQLRDAAFASFAALGFPTAHDEDWRFTNVAPIARTAFQLAPEVAANAETLAPFANGIRFVFVNGRLQESMSALPPGLTVSALTEASRPYLAKLATFDTNAFVALNTAFLDEAACIFVERGAIIDNPIQLVYVTVAGDAPVASHPRTLIVVGEHAKCTVVETYLGTGTYLNNPVTEIILDTGASVDHYKVQRESSNAFHVATLQAELGPDSCYSTTSISLGGSLVRNNAGARLSERSEATLNGLYLANGTQHVDNQLIVDHARPNASSHELYKGILNDKATAAFNGKILVRKDAQKTDAKQTNKNLLLSDDAIVNTKPELQILADDVRCTHGATVGQLDPEAAFYLRSRGIDWGAARRMLTYAFAQDVVDRVNVPSLRSTLEWMINEKLNDSRE